MEVVGEAVMGGKRVETKTLFKRGGKFRARQDFLPPHLTRGQTLKARGEKSHSHPLVWYHSVITFYGIGGPVVFLYLLSVNPALPIKSKYILFLPFLYVNGDAEDPSPPSLARA